MDSGVGDDSSTLVYGSNYVDDLAVVTPEAIVCAAKLAERNQRRKKEVYSDISECILSMGAVQKPPTAKRGAAF